MKTARIAYVTGLTLQQVQQTLREALTRKASIVALEIDPLQDPDDLGVLIEQKMGLFAGVGAAQVLANELDDGGCVVEFIALGSTIGEGLVMGMAKDVSGHRQLGDSKQLVEKLVDALHANDPHIEQVD